MSATGLEQRDRDASLVAVKPRVTLDQIKSLVASEKYFVDDTLTICALTLTNGFKVTGESAAADPANFNEELGRKIAKDKALAEIWPLAGFLLRDTLHRDAHPPVMRAKATLSGRSPMFKQAPWDKGGKPRGRYSEKPYSYKDYRGDMVSGTTYELDTSDPTNIEIDGESLTFAGVCPPTCGGDAPENLIFGDATPFLDFRMTVRNQNVLKSLKTGKAYYIDFIPVPE